MPLLEPVGTKNPFLFTDNSPQDFDSLSNEEKNVLLDHVAAEFANDPKAMERLAQKFLQEVTPKDFTTVTIQPHPGFVLKTKITKSNSSKLKVGNVVYINICYDDAIPKPPVANEDQIQKALNAEPDATYRVPLSMGQPRFAGDALIMDACIHTQPYMRTERDLDFRLYILELSIEFVEESQHVELSREFTLPNLQSKGTIPSRALRLPKPSLISAVKKEKKPATSKVTATSQVDPSVTIDKSGDRLTVVIPNLPAVNPSSWSLDIEPTQLVLGGVSSRLKTVKLPHTVDVQHADTRAQFYKKSRDLVIHLVLAPRRQFL